MTPILEGLDGVQKMSKSLGNHIAINEVPEEIYGKVMSISDSLMWRYYKLLTDLPLEGIKKLKAETDSGTLHPMQAKSDLAFQIVKDFHSDKSAQAAQQHFSRVVQERQNPENMPILGIHSEGIPILLSEVIAKTDFASSKAESRRLIQQGGVSIDGVKIKDPAHRIQPNEKREFILRVGKRKFSRIKFLT